ncbi:fatty acyl-CoA reductase wat-like isoform X2 [Belonocnema kinseyi]|nr:fatty acyl-CoA reductase wat-like isoform X2 [Belonocnema kinseyi]
MFEPLRKVNPDFLRKLIPICGDATKPGLGISDQDRELIIKEVSIIFHAAASTRFDELLRFSVPINVNSVMEIMSICRECTNLKAAVYVSTAFSQCIYGNIKEKVYSLPMSYEEINNTVQIIKRRNLSKEDEVAFTKILLGNFPNTYVFTKSIAEGLLNERAKDLPFSIFRFPIALATYKEPLPGWIDTIQGLNQAMVGVGLGIIRLFNVDGNANLHVVPADWTCNALIGTAYETDTFKNRENPDELPVYNYAANENNILTWNKYRPITLKYTPHMMPIKAVYYPYYFFIKSARLFTFLHFILHFLPAILGDVVLRISGRKPILHKVFKKGNKFIKVTKFFTLWNWTFESKMVQSMWNKLSEADKRLIPFDLTHIDWEDFTVQAWQGTLTYALKDYASSEERFNKFKRLQKIHRTIQILVAAIIIWFIWKLYLVLL